MTHHKRRRPKNQRAGCLMCKPHKANGAKKKSKPKHEPLPGDVDIDEEIDDGGGLADEFEKLADSFGSDQ